MSPTKRCIGAYSARRKRWRRFSHDSKALETDELHAIAGLKGRERPTVALACLTTRGHGTCDADKPPVSIVANRGSGNRYVLPAKAADESTSRLLLADRTEESLTVYTDGFRASEPLDEGDIFDRGNVVHGERRIRWERFRSILRESRIAGAIPALAPLRSHQGQLTWYLRPFQLRRRVYRKPAEEALKFLLKTVL